MAQKPICIITPTGMICDSASFEWHFHGGTDKCHKDPKLMGDAEKVRNETTQALNRGGIAADSVYGRVVQLMKLANVNDETPFTVFTK